MREARERHPVQWQPPGRHARCPVVVSPRSPGRGGREKTRNDSPRRPAAIRVVLVKSQAKSLTGTDCRVFALHHDPSTRGPRIDAAMLTPSKIRVRSSSTQTLGRVSAFCPLLSCAGGGKTEFRGGMGRGTNNTDSNCIKGCCRAGETARHLARWLAGPLVPGGCDHMDLPRWDPCYVDNCFCFFFLFLYWRLSLAMLSWPPVCQSIVFFFSYRSSSGTAEKDAVESRQRSTERMERKQE